VRITRAIGVIGLSCSLGFGCASRGITDAETYVVRPQDTLYGIAWQHDLDFRDLARWNNIGPDFRIAVGQVLLLQPPDHPLATHAAPVAAARPAPSAAAHPQMPAAVPKSADAPMSGGVQPSIGASAASMQWVWPTDRTAAPKPVPGGGILLMGQLGQAIRAASSGRVVYVGNGIRGYGNLVIIKHGDTLLSAYAHTSELLVREGQNVGSGQAIAHMGTGPHQIAALYFEIRLNGKPVDPLPYLNGMK
jgi:lipoprotein NlpD